MFRLKSNEADILCSWASSLGITLSRLQLHLLCTFLDQLWEWNQRMNLTGLPSRERIIGELLLDSLIPSLFLPEEGNVLDLGSGAGFPGIPLKIVKGALTFHLLEANEKKVAFLRQVIRMTGLSGIVVLRGRIEKEKALLRTEGYDVITARAVAGLRQTLKWCAPHLAPEGMIVNFQGSHFEDALVESAEFMQQEDLTLSKSIPYVLPGKTSQRHLLLFVRSAM